MEKYSHEVYSAKTRKVHQVYGGYVIENNKLQLCNQIRTPQTPSETWVTFLTLFQFNQTFPEENLSWRKFIINETHFQRKLFTTTHPRTSLQEATTDSSEHLFADWNSRR